jgi:hypothetical protein
MKRALASPDVYELTEGSIHASKRYKPFKPYNTNESPNLDRAFKRRRSDTPPLTQESLNEFNRRTESNLLAQIIKQWADDCDSNGLELDMPPQPTPSITPSGSGRRRAAKLVQRQRSQSPVKKANSPQYRAMNMADANVFVDHLPDPPPAIEEQLGYILGSNPWLDSQRGTIEELATQYCEKSRLLAKRCAGENEWRSQLSLGLLQPLIGLELDNILVLSASEKRGSAPSVVKKH